MSRRRSIRLNLYFYFQYPLFVFVAFSYWRGAMHLANFPNLGIAAEWVALSYQYRVPIV